MAEAGIGIRYATIADSEGIAQLVTDLGYPTSPGQLSGNQRADAHAFYEKHGYTFTGRRYKRLLGSSG